MYVTFDTNNITLYTVKFTLMELNFIDFVGNEAILYAIYVVLAAKIVVIVIIHELCLKQWAIDIKIVS